MANTPGLMVRIEPELIRDASLASGLGTSAPAAQVIRLALAMLAKRPDPLRVAATRRGPKPKTGAAA